MGDKKTGKSEGGCGLFNIQERMADLGGSLDIIFGPGRRGCRAIISVPLRSDDDGVERN